MYMVGEFSKISKVTAKTLRYYDQVGLFTPREINKETGYRYYSSDQLQQLNRIIELREYGFTINEIKELMEVEISEAPSQRVDEMLEQKRQELKEQMMELQKKIKQIESYMSGHASEKTNCQVLIKEIPKQNVASLRDRIFDFNEHSDKISEIGNVLSKQKILYDENHTCFTIYHDCEYKENDIDVEICRGVNKMGVDTDKVVFKEVKKIDMAAYIIHKGSIKSIRKSYAYLLEWIEKNNYEMIGALRECYINMDSISMLNGKDGLIEIQAPVRLKTQ